MPFLGRHPSPLTGWLEGQSAAALREWRKRLRLSANWSCSAPNLNGQALKPMATIRVNRGNLPAIKLGHVRVQLSRRKRDSGSSGSVLKIGNFSFPGAFVQQLNNGRWHVLRRTGKSRYPVEVVKVPLATPDCCIQRRTSQTDGI